MNRNFEYRTINYIVRVFADDTNETEVFKFIDEASALDLLHHYYELGFTVTLRREQIAVSEEDIDKLDYVPDDSCTH